MEQWKPFVNVEGRKREMKDYSVIPIPKEETLPWILKKHYAKRKPSISYAFGLYRGNDLAGVCTVGKPASNELCIGVCGEKFGRMVFELNRLCLQDNRKNEASFFIGSILKKLKGPMILISYADTKHNHIGYVYQATNWYYTGLTDRERKTPRGDKVLNNETHSRHGKDKVFEIIRRKPKHRYVYFIGAIHQDWGEMYNALKYPILPYPKGESKRYDSGERVRTQGKLFF